MQQQKQSKLWQNTKHLQLRLNGNQTCQTCVSFVSKAVLVFSVGVKPPHLAPQQQCVPNMSVVYQANSGKKIEKDEKKKLEKQLAELKKEMSEPKSKFRIDLETFVSRFAHFCG